MSLKIISKNNNTNEEILSINIRNNEDDLIDNNNSILATSNPDLNAEDLERKEWLAERIKNLNFEPCAVDKILSYPLIQKMSLAELQEKVAIRSIGKRKMHATDEASDHGQIEQAKHYLYLNDKQGEGGCSNVFIGFSRKGTERAISIAKHVQEAQKLEKQMLLANQLTSENAPHIARVKNHEGPYRAAILGGKDLAQGKIWELSQEARLTVYQDLFQGLDEMHRLGLVHRDIKLENVVFNQKEDKIGALIIDYIDFLTQEGAITQIQGSPIYFSPEIVRHILTEFNYDFEASSKSDMWAAMLMICEIELRAQKYNRSSLLSPAFLKSYEKYRTTAFQNAKLLSTPKGFIEFLNALGQQFSICEQKNNLFIVGFPSPKFPMDKIVKSMGYLTPNERASAAAVLDQINSSFA